MSSSLLTLSSLPSGPFEGRAKIEGATVTLHRVTQEDAGEYRCEISAPLDSVSLGETNVTLKVLGKTDRLRFQCSSNILYFTLGFL